MTLVEAHITDIDITARTCKVVLDSDRGSIDDVPFATPYANTRGGFMGGVPEPGTKCLVQKTVDGNYFVSGFIGIPDKGTYGKNNPKATLGDMSISTGAGNEINVRRSGLIELASNSLTKRLYVPTGNMIQDYFRRYHGRCPGGEISLEALGATFIHGAGAARFGIQCRGSAANTSMSVAFRLGAVTKPSQTMDFRLGAKVPTFTPGPVEAELKVGLTGANGSAAYIYQVLGTGDVAESTTKNHLKQVDGTYASVCGAVFHRINGQTTVETAGPVQVTCDKSMFIEALDFIKVKAPNITLDGVCHLGSEDASQGAIRGTNFLISYFSHTHGGQVPAPEPPISLTDILSTKVFVK